MRKLLKNMNIKSKMLMAFLVPTILLFSGLLTWMVIQTDNIMENLVNRDLITSTDRTSYKLETFTVQKEVTLKILASSLTKDVLNDNSSQATMLINALKSQKGVKNIVVGFDDKSLTKAIKNNVVYDPTTRPWYKNAINKEGLVYSDIYEDIVTKKAVVSISQRLANDKGVICMDIDLDQLSNWVSEVKIGKTGYAFLVNREGKMVYHPTRKIGDNFLEEHKEWTEYFRLDNGVTKTVIGKASDGELKEYIFAPIDNTDFTVIFAVPIKELIAEKEQVKKISIICGLVVILILGLIIYFVATYISKQIKNMSVASKRLADCDLTVQLSEGDVNSKDEIDLLHHDFNVMKNNVSQVIKSVSSTAEQVAATSEELTATINENAQALGSVTASMGENVAKTEEQVVAMEKIIKLLSNVEKVRDDVNKKLDIIVDLSNKTKDASQQGQQNISVTNNKIDLINNNAETAIKSLENLIESSKKIDDIINVITGISDQTNLLALNASIEAARAGDAGRGFAVVADEVRKLAEQSQEAAKQIAKLIKENDTNIKQVNNAMDSEIVAVKEGITAVQQTSLSFEKIDDMINNVSNLIAEIDALNKDTNEKSYDVAKAIEHLEGLSNEITINSQSVLAATEEQTASSEEIGASSEGLAQLAQGLQQDVNKFKI